MAGISIDIDEVIIPTSKNPISLLQEVSATHHYKLPEYSDADGTYNMFGCDVRIYYGKNPEDDYANFHGRSQTKKGAKTDAAEQAIRFLQASHPEIFSAPPPELTIDVDGLTPMMRELSSNKQTFSTKSESALKKESDELKHDRLGLEFGQLLQRARMEKGLTQKDLASKINEKSNIVVEYEAGRAVPNPHIVSKLERALRVKLVGPSAGQTFNKKK